MVSFGSTPPGGFHRHGVILLGHVVEFLRSCLRQNWDALRTAEFKDPAFGFLMTVEKKLSAACPPICGSEPRAPA
jgi:hypothetical protein